MAFVKRIAFFLLTNIAVLALFSIIIACVQYFFPGLKTGGFNIWYSLIYAAIFGFLGAFFSLAISRWSAKELYNITLIDDNSSREHAKLHLVYQTVERIARENGITTPEVGYYEDAEPNAFATGATKNSALVAVSTGLLNVMEKDEIEGVVGHEMAHILNGDMVTLTLIQGVINTFVIFLAQMAARAINAFLSKDGDDGLGWLAYNAVYVALQIVFGFIGSLVVNYFSRIREYHADAGGAKYTSKEKMIAGLARLQKITALKPDEETKMIEANKKMSPFLITSPESNEEKDSIFSTHPSLSNRIKALHSLPV